MWKLFPRIIEHKINTLLDQAVPNPTKAYQLYKACQYDNVWSASFGNFSDSLGQFFSLPPNDRSKSRIDALLDRPIDKSLYENFKLDFRSASVNQSSVMNVAGWTHNVLRVNLKSSCQVISLDVMKKTLNYITQPPPYEKADNIEFDDFCGAWRQVVFQLFGKKYDYELGLILKELLDLNSEEKLRESTERFIPLIYLTQTEILWTECVCRAAEDFATLPKFPLQKGPQKNQLAELERAVRLYNLILNSDKPELSEHRANVRSTIIHRCQELLRACAR